MANYTIEDQEFLFNKSNEILEHFGLLDETDFFDVIECFSDLIVNSLDKFKHWKRENNQLKQREIDYTPKMLSILKQLDDYLKSQNKTITIN